MMMDASIRLQATVPVRESQTLDRERRREAEGDRENMGYNLTSTDEHKLSLTWRVEDDIEEVAELLYRVIDDADGVVREMVPDEIRERDEYTVDFRSDEAELTVLSSGVAHVYLAARKRALELTKQSMSRRGTSVEQVLIRWFNGRGEEDASDGLIDVSMEDLPEATRHVLFGLMMEHTPGGEIDADAVPPRDEWGDARLDKQDMLPERDEQPAD